MKRKEDKSQIIDSLAEQLSANNNIYLADTSTLTVEKISSFRRMCFEKSVSLQVVKNTLLKKAMEKSQDKDFSELYDVLKGTTAIMFSETGNAPAKLISEFRKSNERPLLKAAYVEEMTYVGDDQLATLTTIKSKDELIGDVIALLQSPAKNVVSALQSGKNKLAGIVKTLSEKSE